MQHIFHGHKPGRQGKRGVGERQKKSVREAESPPPRRPGQCEATAQHGEQACWPDCCPPRPRSHEGSVQAPLGGQQT